MTRHAPTFDTAAFTAEELAAASACGPTDLPDCVPGGCGGLTVDTDGVTRNPGGGVTMVFRQAGDFTATREAERRLREAGFSVGRSQRGAPRGILFGDFDIQKWRNLNCVERYALHGTMTGDGRLGPVTIRLHVTCPHQAAAALTAALSNGEPA